MNKFKKIFRTKNKSCLSLVLGAISALAMPPFCAFPLLFIAFPIMLYIFNTAENKKKAFWYGWLYGVGYFVFGLYWISNAIIDDFPYFVPLAILGLPMILSLYYGLAGAITKSVKWKGIGLVLSFSIIFSAMEIARGYLFTGFPWNLTAYTWSNYLPAMQGVNYFGIYGFSFLSILLFTSPCLLFKNKTDLYKKCHSEESPELVEGHSNFLRSRRISMCLFAFYFLAFASLVVYGYSFSLCKKNIQLGKKVLFVQPSVPLKISNLDSMHVFEQYYKMTAEAMTQDIDIIAWGETAIPLALNEYPEYLEKLSYIIPDGAHLFTGSIRTDEDGNYYNSILVINSNGEIVASYDKSHLVPFGEYMPFEDDLPLEKIVGFNFIFSKGSGAKTINLNNRLKFSPNVCYEMIFPDAIIDEESSTQPEFIFNVSNDTFYGESSGPYQHFAMAQAQAIANRLPVVRVGNNGISGIIDKYGRVLDFIPLNKTGTKVISF